MNILKFYSSVISNILQYIISSAQIFFANVVEFSKEEDNNHNRYDTVRIGMISCTDCIYPIMKITSHTLLAVRYYGRCRKGIQKR